MRERLLELMRMKNLTFSQLADTIGVQRSGISHFASGRNKPSLEFILKILNHFPDVNPDWLLFGKEPVFRAGYQASDVEPGTEEPVDNVRISLREDLDVSQPSFIDELFSEPVNLKNTTEREVTPAIKNKESKQQQTPGQAGITSEKKEPSVDKPVIKEEVVVVNNESPERIVIFYKNKTFREYFPEL